VDVPAPVEPAAIARATLDGFNHHYALFRDCAHIAKRHFEEGNWLAVAHFAGSHRLL
jgi:isocitrate dehydrogenase kinase/phosphatase